ncbi:MAG: hypothetical protein H0X30_08600, partial [Anaerolineae bacterium]|nr:hypothetical protein [Anaerolineae bacterium]
MAWTMHWYDNVHTIVLFTVEKNSTWNDFHDAMNRYAQELENTTKKIDVIIDDRFGLPSGSSLPHLKVQMKKLEKFENFGLIVSVSRPTTMSFLLNIIEMSSKFFGIAMKKGVMVKTMHEAIKLIEISRTQAQ